MFRFFRRKERIFKVEGACKASFEMLIREIQDCENLAEVKNVLNSWIKANDLHPENVITLSEEEFRAKFKK